MSDSRVDVVMRDGPGAFGLSFKPNTTIQTIHVSESWPLRLVRHAETYGEWAVVQMSEGCFRVSHVPTGRCVGSVIPDLSLAVARLVAARFADSLGDRGADLSAWTDDDMFIMEAIVAEELAR